MTFLLLLFSQTPSAENIPCLKLPYLRVKCPEPHHLLWACREGPFSLVRIPLSYSLTHSPLHPHFAYSVDMCCVSTHVQSLLEPGEAVLKAQRLMAPGQLKGTDLTQERPTFRPDCPIPGLAQAVPRSQRPPRHPLIAPFLHGRKSSLFPSGLFPKAQIGWSMVAPAEPKG